MTRLWNDWPYKGQFSVWTDLQVGNIMYYIIQRINVLRWAVLAQRARNDKEVGRDLNQPKADLHHQLFRLVFHYTTSAYATNMMEGSSLNVFGVSLHEETEKELASFHCPAQNKAYKTWSNLLTTFLSSTITFFQCKVVITDFYYKRCPVDHRNCQWPAAWVLQAAIIRMTVLTKSFKITAEIITAFSYNYNWN